MNRIELNHQLDILEIDPKNYSLNGDLNFDSVVLYENYSKWEVFYLDEKGRREKEKTFISENEACLYIFRIFEDIKKMREKFGIR